MDHRKENRMEWFKGLLRDLKTRSLFLHDPFLLVHDNFGV